MAFDLRGALIRKAEYETAKLLDFDFRLRARTARVLAQALGLDQDIVIDRIATHDHDAMIAALAADTGRDPADIQHRWWRCEAGLRPLLIAELGDPTPHRMA